MGLGRSSLKPRSLSGGRQNTDGRWRGKGRRGGRARRPLSHRTSPFMECLPGGRTLSAACGLSHCPPRTNRKAFHRPVCSFLCWGSQRLGPVCLNPKTLGPHHSGLVESLLPGPGRALPARRGPRTALGAILPAGQDEDRHSCPPAQLWRDGDPWLPWLRRGSAACGGVGRGSHRQHQLGALYGASLSPSSSGEQISLPKTPADSWLTETECLGD